MGFRMSDLIIKPMWAIALLQLVFFREWRGGRRSGGERERERKPEREKH